MRVSQVDRRRLIRAGAVGAAATGLGGIPASDAAVVYTPVNQAVSNGATPWDNPFEIDLNGDAQKEFGLNAWFFATKADGYAPGANVVIDGGGFVANLAEGTLIDASSTFGAPGGDFVWLNGRADHDSDGNTPDEVVGNFNTPNGTNTGFIGVRFDIGGAAHYGYVGYEGIDIDPGDPIHGEGHIFALGYEDAPNTGIEAGAGIPAGQPADFDGDDDVDGEDLLIWQRGLGLTGQTDNSNGDADGNEIVEGADLDLWKAQFGGAAVGAISAVPEPTSLALLAAGAAGLTLYRRRRGSA